MRMSQRILLDQKKKKKTNEAPTKGHKGTIVGVFSPGTKKSEIPDFFDGENDSEPDTPIRPTAVESTKNDTEIRPNTHPICVQADTPENVIKPLKLYSLSIYYIYDRFVKENKIKQRSLVTTRALPVTDWLSSPCPAAEVCCGRLESEVADVDAGKE